MELGKLQIPKLNIEPFNFVNDYQTRLFLQFVNIVEKTEDGKVLLEAISNDPRVKALEGKMISSGSMADRFDATLLTMWFLWYANEHGIESAEAHLNSFLDESVVPVINTLWVLGIEVKEPIQLNDGFEILPIANLPDSREKEAFLQWRSDFPSRSRSLPTSAIIYRCKVSKIASDNPLTDEVNPEFWQSSSRLTETAMLMNALDGISCLPYFSTSYNEPTVPFGPFGGSGGSSPHYDVMGYGMSKLTASDQPIIDGLVQNYNKLSDQQKERFKRILTRLSQAKRRSQIEDKILDLGITLEMLLLEDNPNNEQLSLSFRLRGSWLLGKTEQDRKTIYHHLKNIYNYRSQVAHSGILCNGDSRKIQEVQEAFPTYQAIASQVCSAILSNGKPDWNSLILGVGSED